LPCLEPIEFLSLSNCKTNADDDKDKLPPIVTAAAVLSPAARANPVAAAAVTKN